MTKDIFLNGKKGPGIGPAREPLVIAEAGVLTWGEVERGKRFVDEAIKAGLKLLKFQAFNAEHVVSSRDEFWLKRLKQRELSKENYFEIQKYAESKGLTVFATTHNEYDLVDFARSGMPILKIGSGDSNNFRMIDMALTTGKPVIVSLGLMSEKETFAFLKKYKKYSGQLIVMHCVTLYPTPAEKAAITQIDTWAKKFPDYNFGYSDHVIGSAVSLAAVARGNVRILEKHICLDEDKVQPKHESLDIVVALTPSEMGKFVRDVHDVWLSLQSRGAEDFDKNSAWARKAIVARTHIPNGAVITPEDLESKRPFDEKSGDISISLFDFVVGAKTRRDIPAGEALRRSDISRVLPKR